MNNIAEVKGTVFEIERFAIHDGPGIRTIVFLKGCPLSCRWCANPESQSIKPQLMYWESRCMGCKRCIGACPMGALSWNGAKIVVDRTKCKVCGECADVCNSEALTPIGEIKSVSEVMDVISRDADFYKKSGGGITFSGGEVFAQTDFLCALAMACKERGFHTCIETAGYTDYENIESVLPYLDLVMMDLKCMDPVRHEEMIGKSNEKILDNFRRIAETGKPLVARIPVIPGLNNNMKNFEDLAAYLSDVAPGCRIDLLPYHSLGVSKYDRLDKPYFLKDTVPPAKDELEIYKEFLEGKGFEVTIGG